MPEQIEIKNGNRNIEASLWQESQHNKSVIIAPALGVSRHFYKHLAAYFFSHSYNVLSFDYPMHADKPVRLVEWGYVDLPEVIDFAKKQFDRQPLYFLGHSIAGQILPLAANKNQLKAACLVATQNVGANNWTGFDRFKVNIFWHALIPFCTGVLGYLPGYAYGGNNLPKSIANDWRSWALNENGLLGYLPEAGKHYDEIEIPTKFINFVDDIFAPPISAKNIFESYGTREKEIELLSPKETGVSALGHFNFFRKSFSSLWPKAKDWLEKY